MSSVLIMIFLLTMARGMHLVLWLGVWHGKVVSMPVYGPIILLDMGCE